MSIDEFDNEFYVEDCKPLLEACIPSLYILNPFRITGLNVEASIREIKRRIDDLKSAYEMKDAESENNEYREEQPQIKWGQTNAEKRYIGYFERDNSNTSPPGHQHAGERRFSKA